MIFFMYYKLTSFSIYNLGIFFFAVLTFNDSSKRVPTLICDTGNQTVFISLL